MNVPILIIGYERSGTTLLRRLVSMHPSLESDLVHEKPWLLRDAQSIDHALETMTFVTSSIKSGQKLPYLTFHQAERNVKKFLSLFPDGYLMHIIRQPLETISSQVKTFRRKPKHCVHNYYASVFKVYDYVRSLPNSCTVKYESLISDPRTVLSKIYAWMGEEVGAEHIERVITTQDNWIYNDRAMPGLRYFKTIIPSNRKITLPPDIIENVKSRPLLEYIADF